MTDRDVRINQKPNSGAFLLSNSETIFTQNDPRTLTLTIPDVEEIARALWQRQHDTLNTEAITYGLKWRDRSVPSKFWHEFLLDAQVILTMLYKRHSEYQSARENY